MGGAGGVVELIQLQCYEQRFESGASSPSLESCPSTPLYYPPSTWGDPQLLQMRPLCAMCLSVYCIKLASRAKIPSQQNPLQLFHTESEPACLRSAVVTGNGASRQRRCVGTRVCCSTMCLSFQKSIACCCCCIFTTLWMITRITT